MQSLDPNTLLRLKVVAKQARPGAFYSGAKDMLKGVEARNRQVFNDFASPDLVLQLVDHIERDLRKEGESVEAWQSLAAALYQAAGEFVMPTRYLDALSNAANGKPFSHLIDDLLPVSINEPGPVKDWQADFEKKFSHLPLETLVDSGVAAYKDPKTQGAWEGWVSAKEAVRIEDVKEHLAAQHIVYVNMLRRIIAPITMSQCAHVHGQDMVRRWSEFEAWERDYSDEPETSTRIKDRSSQS